MIEPEYDMDDVGKQAEFDRRRRKETEKAGKMSDPPNADPDLSHAWAGVGH
jgi:hypothetical protein